MPVNPKAKLVENLFDPAIKQEPTRMGYGEGLKLLGDKNPNVVALCADLTGSTQTKKFADSYPDRFVQMGVAEQNLVTVASGMAAAGKIPYVASYTMFCPGRAWEQVRTTICYNDQPVKIAGAHAGVSVGPDGATHQAIEDIAIMRTLPNMQVFSACDSIENRKVTMTIADTGKPAFFRFQREKTPVFTTEETPFQIGKAQVFWEGKDVAIIACGPLVYNALLAARDLEQEGISCMVVNNASIKPMDEEVITNAAKTCGAVVTVEEHQIMGGMGSRVAEILVQHHPVPMEFVGVHDRFGESGEPNELIEAFGMGVGSIKEAIKKVLKRKS
ncbi:MAG: transketolase C-terminal domain-containing protein [bacterium]|nr:transketolase C-terminal domain-containing protein [bacterium]